MIQRHMPLGYRMVKGKIEIEPEKAELVRLIFREYLEGNSMYRIADKMMELGALNASHKPTWTHGTVGKILQNQKYQGDGYYPPIIEKADFEQAQKRRQERSQELGRIMQPNSFGKTSVFAGHLVCGTCGQTYRRYVEHCNQPGEKINWKCKRYIDGNRVYCRNIFLVDRQIEDAFMELVKKLTGKPELVKPKIPEKALPYNRKAAQLTEQLQELGLQPEYPAQEMVRLIYERAKEQYQSAPIRDRRYQTEKLMAAIRTAEPELGFQDILFRSIIHKAIVQTDGRLEFELINGVIIDIPIGEGREN